MKAPAAGKVAEVVLSANEYSVEEGEPLEVTLTATTAAGTARPRREMTVAFLTAPGTAAINADYGHLSLNAPFVVADWTGSGPYTQSVTVSVQTLEDSEYEGSEQFRVTIDNTPGEPDVHSCAPEYFDSNGACFATVTINDDGDTLGVGSVAVSSSPAAGAVYKAGETIAITVTFTGVVTVTGTPRFALDLGGETRHAAYASGTGTKELVFSYRVAGGDADSDGISWAADSLGLNGGAIRFTTDAAVDRVDADLGHDAQAALPGHKVDAATPENCGPSEAGTIWCATLTVGDEDTDFFLGLVGGQGSLSDADFEYGGVTYTITQLFNLAATSSLVLELDPQGLAVFNNIARFRLHVGTHEFSFDDAEINSVQQYNWSGVPDFSWSVDDMVAVKLVEFPLRTLGVASVAVSSSPAAGAVYKSGESIDITVTFNAAVTVTGTPRFAFDLGGETRHAAYASGSGTKELVFSYTVADGDADSDGISWAAGRLGLDGGAIRFKTGVAADRADADLGHDAQVTLSDHKVDAAPPRLESATANATELVLSFSEELAAAANLANGAFTVKKTPAGGAETTLALTGSPSVSGSTVTLTLASAPAVTATDTDMKVSYAKPGTDNGNRLEDGAGNEVADFIDERVFNSLGEIEPPALSATSPAVLAADGLTLTLTYNEALGASSVPAATAFTVEATPAGGAEEEVALAGTGPVRVSGRTVVLTLARLVAHSDAAVKVSYAGPGTGAAVEDLNGNDAGAFTDLAVTNGSAVPRVSIEAVHADATPWFANPEFKVTRSNTDADDALVVNIAITQAVDYLDPTAQTLTIPAGATTATGTFPSTYSGNTSGDLVATVAGGDDHLPAVAPDHAATVRMKVAAAGKVAEVVLSANEYSVAEGELLVVTLTATTAAGTVRPRRDATTSLSTAPGTATVNVDYTHVSEAVAFAVADWTGSGPYTQSVTVSVQTLEDSEYEGSEQFRVEITNTQGEPDVQSCAPEYFDNGACFATVTVNDDEESLGVASVAVSSSPIAGAVYKLGETIGITVTFTGAVTVTGRPRFALDLGGETRHAAYASGTGTKELVFSYRVAGGDADSDGISWAADSLGLNGGAIRLHDR